MAEPERPDERKRPAPVRHPLARMIVIGVLSSVIGTVLVLWMDWFPEPASTAADDIDFLYDLLLVFSVPIFVLVMAVAIYSVITFRARPGDKRDGEPIHGNTRLEIFWVTVPFLIVSGLAAYSWIVLDDIEAKQPNEQTIGVIGQQFIWTFEYESPTGGKPVRTNELVLQKDRPVKFEIKGIDVIHSFWVPEFRLKSDAVPGVDTTIRLTPNKNGNYSVVCAELCGIGHATMRQKVRVVEEGEYTAWLGEQARRANASAPGSGAGGPPEEESSGADAEGPPGEQQPGEAEEQREQ